MYIYIRRVCIISLYAPFLRAAHKLHPHQSHSHLFAPIAYSHCSFPLQFHPSNQPPSFSPPLPSLSPYNPFIPSLKLQKTPLIPPFHLHTLPSSSTLLSLVFKPLSTLSRHHSCWILNKSSLSLSCWILNKSSLFLLLDFEEVSFGAKTREEGKEEKEASERARENAGTGQRERESVCVCYCV